MPYTTNSNTNGSSGQPLELRVHVGPADYAYNSVIHSQINMEIGSVRTVHLEPSLFVGFAGIVLKNHMD